MANITGVKGAIPEIRAGYRKLLALGEGVVSDEFIMTFEDVTDIRYLVQTTQMPALQREVIESYGPHGVQFNQQGRYKNAQDIPISFKEVISGKIYEFVRDWVQNKKYLAVKLALTGESYTSSIPSNSLLLEDCWLELEGVDLSVEDGGTLMRPSGTLHANWLSFLDEDQSVTLSMER